MKKDAPLFFKSPCTPIEARSAVDSTACYEKHTHDELSIGIVEAGISEFYHAGSITNIGPGSVVIINPNVVHSCNPKAGEWSYKMLYIDTEWLKALLNKVLGLSHIVLNPNNLLHTNCLATYRDFNALFVLITEAGEQSEIEKRMVGFISRLLLIESWLIEKQGSNAGNRSSAKVHSQRLALSRAFIIEHCTSNLRLDDVASVAGMSRYHFIRAFRRAYGIAPHAFQVAQRVSAGRKLLSNGMSISKIAVNLGFSDQSHFHRNFKKLVATTPKRYKDGMSNQV
jgi:AraC-like DNA-binding protein